MNSYLEGRIPLIQLADGDVIFITARKNTVIVSGLAENAKQFEFNDSGRSIGSIIKFAKPFAKATHIQDNSKSGNN